MSVDIMNLMYDLIEADLGTKEEFLAKHVHDEDDRIPNEDAYDLVLGWMIEGAYRQASMLVEKYFEPLEESNVDIRATVNIPSKYRRIW